MNNTDGHPAESRMKIVAVCLTFAVSLASASCRPEGSGGVRNHIPIGHDTTRIDGPMRPDGLIDYVEALNNLYGNVDPTDNAGILLAEALVGPALQVTPESQPEVFAHLGIAAFRKGDALPLFDSYRIEEYQAVYNRPWLSNEFPQVWEWLRTNEEFLGLMRDAVALPDYYLPFYTSSPTDTLIDAKSIVLAPHCRKAVQAFLMRSRLAMAENRVRDAWRDIRVVHHLSDRIGKSAYSDSALARGYSSDASAATITLATQSELSLEDGWWILNEIKELPPVGDASRYTDTTGRYMILDFMQRLVVGDKVSLWQRRLPDTERQTVLALIEVTKDVSYEEVLRQVNAALDDFVATLREGTFAERKAATEHFGFKVNWLGEWLRQMEDHPAENWMSRLLIRLGLFGPFYSWESQAYVMRDLSMVSVALAVYRAEHGEYPTTLDALSPRYLESIPDDFFSGRPFVYRSTETGYTVYSVGFDMEDNGGCDESDIVVTK